MVFSQPLKGENPRGHYRAFLKFADDGVGPHPHPATVLSLADEEKEAFSKVLRYALLTFKKYGKMTERYEQAMSGTRRS